MQTQKKKKNRTQVSTVQTEKRSIQVQVQREGVQGQRIERHSTQRAVNVAPVWPVLTIGPTTYCRPFRRSTTHTAHKQIKPAMLIFENFNVICFKKIKSIGLSITGYSHPQNTSPNCPCTTSALLYDFRIFKITPRHIYANAYFLCTRCDPSPYQLESEMMAR